MSLSIATRRTLSLVGILAMALPVAVKAQTISSVAPRIVQQVDDAVHTRLHGNVSAVVQAAVDRGATEPATQMTHIRLVLGRSSEQQAALDEYKRELQDSNSPNFHKWLTPEQFGKLYGPADSDIAAITAWVESQGLQVEKVSPGRTNIAISGSVAQVEAAFKTQIHSYEAAGQTFLSNTTNPSIPSALASVVTGIGHLNTLRPVSSHIAAAPGRYDTEAKRLKPVAEFTDTRPQPELTNGTGPYSLYVVPGDAATIYNTPNAYNANYTSGTTYTGAGVTIGIGGDGLIQASTVAAYRSVFLGNSTPPVITNVDNVTANGDTDEAYIDTELSGGLAPGAAIHFYVSSDLVTGIQQAIDENTVDIFSLSFGQCEYYLTTSDNALINGWWEQAATQGIAVTVSTGDNGSAACDATQTSTGANVPTASAGLNVSGFASTPYNIAVGGTDYYPLNSNYGTYVSTSGGSASSYFRTALGYIPESTWNDSTQVNGALSANKPYTGTNANIVGGSGGKSTCSTNTDTVSGNNIILGSCTSGYAKPSWQHGTGVPADGARDLPDISLLAGNGYDAATWLVCTDDTFVQSGITYTTNCVNGTNGFAFTGFGGTSTSAPAFAGILALVQQKTGGRLGQAAKELYSLYNSGNASTIFHDTTVGNNAVSCVSGSPNCSKNSAGFYYETGYNTTTGYDLATGIGSVNATNLINNWVYTLGSATDTVTVTPSATSINTGQSLTVAVVVGPSGGAIGIPSGTVTLAISGTNYGPQTLVNGSASFSFPAGLATGTNTLTVTYSGDVNFATATGSATVTVAAASSVSLTPASATFANTPVGTTNATPLLATLKNSGTAALTGIVISVAGTNASSFSQTNNCPSSLAAGISCQITVTFKPAASGALSGTISVADNATGSPQTIALSGTGYVPAAGATLSPTTVTLPNTAVGSSTSQQVTLSNPGTLALTVTAISIGGANPTSFSATTDCGALPFTLAINNSCHITATFTPTTLGALTASLSVTDNASGSPQSVTLAGNGTEPGAYTLAAAAVSVAPGASGTSAITATGNGGYIGPTTITLNSCALATSPTGATKVPTCAITAATITFASGATTGAGGTLTISTTAATAAVQKAQLDHHSGLSPILGFGSVAVAGLLFFAIPARRKAWRGLLGVFVLIAAFGAFSGCGGGGSSGGGGGGGTPGTTAGTYTFTVTGTDAGGTKQTATLTVTVS